MNALTGQELSVVSETKGTTTDPVLKTMELLPAGPVVMMDTPGLDDEGSLGQQRVKKSFEILRKTDLALLVLDAGVLKAGDGFCEAEKRLLTLREEKKLPVLLVVNKSEVLTEKEGKEIGQRIGEPIHFVSAHTGEGIKELKDAIGKLSARQEPGTCLIGDLLEPEDVVVLVTPIDAAAPKGRMILPQQKTIRDILDHHAVCLVTKETQLSATLNSLKKPPKMVVTDSQAFGVVKDLVAPDVLLTSFSILFARMKGDLKQQVQGALAIRQLKDTDRVLISEGCTHHRQCGDIGTQKLPKLLKNFTGKDLELDFTSGTQFPEDLTGYKLVIHCGGCMLNEREMKYRLEMAKDQKVPMTNYGVAIAGMNGILMRSLEPFREELKGIEI